MLVSFLYLFPYLPLDICHNCLFYLFCLCLSLTFYFQHEVFVAREVNRFKNDLKSTNLNKIGTTLTYKFCSLQEIFIFQTSQFQLVFEVYLLHLRYENRVFFRLSFVFIYRRLFLSSTVCRQRGLACSFIFIPSWINFLFTFSCVDLDLLMQNEFEYKFRLSAKTRERQSGRDKWQQHCYFFSLHSFYGFITQKDFFK